MDCLVGGRVSLGQSTQGTHPHGSGTMFGPVRPGRCVCQSGLDRRGVVVPVLVVVFLDFPLTSPPEPHGSGGDSQTQTPEPESGVL